MLIKKGKNLTQLSIIRYALFLPKNQRMAIEYIGPDGNMVTVNSIAELPESMEIPLAILEHFESLKRVYPVPTIPAEELERLVRKETERYRLTWLKYQDHVVEFHEKFNLVISKATNEDARKLRGLEESFQHSLSDTFLQYSEALKEMAQTHQAVLQTLQKSEIDQVLRQQKRELADCHKYWMSLLKDLAVSQKNDFRKRIDHIYRKIMGESVSDSEDDEVPVQANETKYDVTINYEPNENSRTINRADNPPNQNEAEVQDRPETEESVLPWQQDKVRSLKDMGFPGSDAVAALKIANFDVDQALAILLESPNMIKEYQDAKIRQDSLIQESLKSKLLKKSSSLFNLSDNLEKVQRQVPKLDWEARKRRYSASSKTETGVNNAQPVPTSSRDSKSKNPLEKMMGAFGSMFSEADTIELKGLIRNNAPGNQPLVDTFAFQCGSMHVKVKYNCQLKVDTLQNLLNPQIDDVQRMALKAASDHTLYSSNLCGLVVFVTQSEVATYGNNQKVNTAVFKKAFSTPELHFDSLTDQLALSRQEYPNLTVGDFMITKHSNLCPFQVVFHLICPNEMGTNY